jgi:hypothetical protein
MSDKIPFKHSFLDHMFFQYNRLTVYRNEPLFEEMSAEMNAWPMKKRKGLPPSFPTNIC